VEGEDASRQRLSFVPDGSGQFDGGLATRTAATEERTKENKEEDEERILEHGLALNGDEGRASRDLG
jgi:hypothetical protein